MLPEPDKEQEKKLTEALDRIEKKLDMIIQQNEEVIASQKASQSGSKMSPFSIFDQDLKGGLDAITLLTLPPSFRKTIVALYKLGEATAEHLSKETNRMRAVESAHANDLVRLGFIKKKRVRRKVYFYVDEA